MLKEVDSIDDIEVTDEVINEYGEVSEEVIEAPVYHNEEEAIEATGEEVMTKENGEDIADEVSD